MKTPPAAQPVDDTVCPWCRESFDISALTHNRLITDGRNGPLVWFGVRGQPGMHVHDAVLCDRYLLTWRGFLAWKTRPRRIAISRTARRAVRLITRSTR